MTVFDTTSGTYYPSLGAAIIGSSANDVIALSPGQYVEDLPDITHSLTITATDGLASLSRATPMAVSERAILNVPGDLGIDLTISGLEISGAARPGVDPNGAGILFESGNGTLTVSKSWIHGNQDGILTGGTTASSPAGGMNVVITHSEISDNGAPPGSTYAANGMDHNIYAGTLTSLTVSDSYIHSVFSQGHEIKSRALTTRLFSNRIFDLSPGADGALGSSYSIDVPDGGQVVISGNVIEKGAVSVNRSIVHFGGEGSSPANSLQLCGNTIVSNRASATVVANALDQGGGNIPVTICDNTIYAVGGSVDLVQDSNGSPGDVLTGNVILTAGAPALDTSAPFATPEPAGAATMLLAAISLGITRARRARRRA